MTDTERSSGEADASARWSLLGVGGTVCLCCLFAAPAATGAAGRTVAGGATATLRADSRLRADRRCHRSGDAVSDRFVRL
jgi:hypothetical protein